MVRIHSNIQIIVNNNNQCECTLLSNSEIPATITYPITMPQTLLNVLDDNKRIIFYVYGYLQFPEETNVQLMMEGITFTCLTNRSL